jgi:hypothetical protein
MIRLNRLPMAILAAVVLLAGCSGKTSSKADAELLAQFQGADAALKEKIEYTIASFKTNNYVGAVTTLREAAASASLSAKQQKAIENMQEMMMTKMYREIDHGDSNAIMSRDILQELRRQRR